MKRATFQCDNCGKDRDNDTNHWFVLLEEKPPLGQERCGLIIRHWNKEFAQVAEAKHSCGQDCAMQMASRFLATGNFERKPAGKKESLAGGRNGEEKREL